MEIQERPRTQRESLENAISDYQVNLKNFASGKVEARPGEVYANKRELRKRQAALAQLPAEVK